MEEGSSPQQIYINTVANTAFNCLDVSSNGTYIIASVGVGVNQFTNDQLYLSSNGGVSFTKVGTTDSYSSVAISASGEYIAASDNANTIYSSSNNGQSFTSTTTSSIYTMAMSSDAQYTYIVAPYLNVRQSTNTFSTPTFVNNGSITAGSITNTGTTFSGFIPQPGAEPVICFKKGSKILCADGEHPIEDLKKGMLVKTHLHGDVAIALIGKSDMRHSKKNDKRDQLFVYRKGKNGVTEDLVVTKIPL